MGGHSPERPHRPMSPVASAFMNRMSNVQSFQQEIVKMLNMNFFAVLIE